MNTTGVVLSIVLTGLGTCLMRLAGTTALSHRLTGTAWMRQVPLAVLLVLAISSVAGTELELPSPAVVFGTLAVVFAAVRRMPLLFSVLVGCLVYVTTHHLWPRW